MLNNIRKSLSKRMSKSGSASGLSTATKKKEGQRSACVVKEDKKVADGFRFIRINKITYTDEEGKERPWESAERTTRKGDVDAVFVVATLKKKGEEDKLLLVSQFRPPLNAYCVEFPAGLIDPKEDAATAGLRELKEETGYVGEVRAVSPIVYSDCGFSNCNLQMCHVTVDLDAPVNKIPQAEPEDGEFIQSHLVPKSKVLEYLNNPRHHIRDEEHIVVDARLYAAAIGL